LKNSYFKFELERIF